MTDNPLLGATRQAEDADAALRPKMLDEFVGQAAAKGNLRVFIESARSRREATARIQASGPSGSRSRLRCVDGVSLKRAPLRRTVMFAIVGNAPSFMTASTKAGVPRITSSRRNGEADRRSRRLNAARSR